ncbi:Hypothetical protein CINCED_3A020106 [Cinara cedri]|uniref:Uncharacterized protein n=1 Tax=Cinara cedri TaxID=506608 RepID=A0A5E4NA65_9HEMI|nr:Hypothetical protein CINCED_3A020106 [Cinara cedri]
MMILTPWDWQQTVRQCFSNYNVLNMEQDFLQFNALFKGKNAPFIHRKQNVEKEKVLLSSSVHIQVRQENPGIIYLKSSFDSEFDAVDLNRIKRRSRRLEDSKDKFLTHLPMKSAV